MHTVLPVIFFVAGKFTVIYEKTLGGLDYYGCIKLTINMKYFRYNVSKLINSKPV